MSASRILFLSVVVAALLGALVWALRPVPLAVDLVTARVGPLEVTVAAEGITRIREPFAVVAPLTGTVSRSPVQVGDKVDRARTVVAEIRPAEPAFLDARARRQAEAAVTEAKAATRMAEVRVEQAQADLAHAEQDFARNDTLAKRGVIPDRVYADSRQMRDSARIALSAAQSDLDLNRATLARMEAQLLLPENPAVNGAAGDCCIQITAPQSGTVLSVTDVSARLVQAGSPLLTIGDLADMEITADLLSSDAVRVAVGAPARIERWGGEGDLAARVRRIDPSGFTRISALGIEEQRVPVHLEILSPAADRPGLGDRYRVFARIVVWQSEAALQVPQSALVRHQGDWAVFRAVAGQAVLTRVTLGQQTDTVAQVLSGLAPGEAVVAYPGNRITHGARIAQRPLD